MEWFSPLVHWQINWKGADGLKCNPRGYVIDFFGFLQNIIFSGMEHLNKRCKDECKSKSVNKSLGMAFSRVF